VSGAGAGSEHRIPVAVAGAAGRMGRTLLEAIARDPSFVLVGAFEAPGHPALGQDAGAGLGAPMGVPIRDEPGTALRQAACLIDFTRPVATLAHVEAVRAVRGSMVIGTTGFTEAQRAALVSASAGVPMVLAPNMAVGVNLLFKLAGDAARVLGDQYDIEIVEAHHRQKVDAPSGTALRLGEIVAEAAGLQLPDAAIHGRSGDVGPRPRGEIGFHALRGGDIVGEHTVLFAGDGERLELTVRSSSRLTYARGALRAARFLQGKSAGSFDMQDVLALG